MSALLCSASLLAATPLDTFEQRLLQQMEKGDRVQTYEWLKSLGDEQAKNPSYLDWLSRFAMEQGDYRQAIPVLKRLLELKPNHMGARLDLVIALQLEGRSHEARERLIELNSLLDDRDDLPPQAQQQLDELNKLLADPSQVAVKKDYSGLVVLGGGYDSNANRGADDDTITIRIPGLPPFEQELLPESLKTSDEFVELGIHGEYGEKGNGCRFEPCRLWVAGATLRQYANLDEYDQRQIYLGSRKTYGGRYQREYTVMVQNVRSFELEEFNRIDEQYIAGLEYRQRIPGLTFLSGSLKGDIIDEAHNNESTSFMTTAGINGVVGLGGGPSFNGTNRKLLWDVSASWHQRPDYYAGDNQRLRLSATYPFTVPGDWQGSLGASYRWRQDGDAFSPFFFGNTRREDNEWVLNFLLQRPLGRQWLISSSAQYEQVESSIPLFDVNRFQVSLALAWQF